MPELTSLTKNTLSYCDFSKTEILKILNNQVSNKAHAHDMITIRMLKQFGEPVCRPLNVILKRCIRTAMFPLEWKKPNVVPIHKRDEKQII